MSNLIAHSQQQWVTALFQLAPTGPAWDVAPDTSKFQTFQALADNYARFDSAVIDLLSEMSPATTTFLIDEWELDFNLPDPCISDNLTIEQRRLNLQAKVIRKDALTVEFLETLGDFLNLDITVVVTDILEITVFAGPTAITQEFNCNSACNEPLRNFGNQVLECTISAAVIAGADVIYKYAPVVVGDPMLNIPAIDEAVLVP